MIEQKLSRRVKLTQTSPCPQWSNGLSGYRADLERAYRQRLLLFGRRRCFPSAPCPWSSNHGRSFCGLCTANKSVVKGQEIIFLCCQLRILSKFLPIVHHWSSLSLKKFLLTPQFTCIKQIARRSSWNFISNKICWGFSLKMIFDRFQLRTDSENVHSLTELKIAEYLLHKYLQDLKSIRSNRVSYRFEFIDRTNLIVKEEQRTSRVIQNSNSKAGRLVRLFESDLHKKFHD